MTEPGGSGARPRLAVVGATGVVGQELLGILAAAGWPAERVRAFASARSLGRWLPFGSGSVLVDSLADPAADPVGGAIPAAVFDGIDYVVNAADADTARRLVGPLSQCGATLVDNSSAFRLEPGVPLVIPELNGQLLDGQPAPRLVANPNCSTILLLMAVEPLRRRFGIERLVVATYQAVSGAGAAALDELERQTREVVAGVAPRPEVFPEPCVFNVFAHESTVDPATGHNGEEQKLVAESRRILGLPGLRVAPTCVRVPVRRAHSQAIIVDLIQPATPAEVRELYLAEPEASGIELVDDRGAGRFPTPLRASGGDRVLVGRLRAAADARFDARGATTSHALFACADQLRKGAALNAFQIVERLIAGN